MKSSDGSFTRCPDYLSLQFEIQTDYTPVLSSCPYCNMLLTQFQLSAQRTPFNSANLSRLKLVRLGGAFLFFYRVPPGVHDSLFSLRHCDGVISHHVTVYLQHLQLLTVADNSFNSSTDSFIWLLFIQLSNQRSFSVFRSSVFLCRWSTWLQSTSQTSLTSLRCLMSINKEAWWGSKVRSAHFTMFKYSFSLLYYHLSSIIQPFSNTYTEWPDNNVITQTGSTCESEDREDVWSLSRTRCRSSQLD